MKTVLLLVSTDRFSLPLIRYLVLEGKRYGWKVCVATMFDHSFADRIREEKVGNDLILVSITDFRQCDHAIRKADLVIGMVPDVMLLEIADSCIQHRKPLVSPTRLNRQLFSKKAKAEENDTLILVECGFAPGLDHITAKNVIDNIQRKGGLISSFKTYSGSLVSESAIDNPWEFKVTERTADVIGMGKGNNRHFINHQIQHVPYHVLFDRAEEIVIDGISNTVVIPEDDALYCRKIYELAHAHTVVRGRILRKPFQEMWALLVKLGLTNATMKIELFEDKSFVNFLRSFLPGTDAPIEDILRESAGATVDQVEMLRWLGLMDFDWPEGYGEVTPAALLQYLLDKKFTLKRDDKDCIVMRHELEYSMPQHDHVFTATLVVQGEDSLHSATAKAIGLTTGAAAKSVMLGNIKLKGLHTPVVKEIYEPMLNELLDLGVAFHVEDKRIWRETIKERFERAKEPILVHQTTKL